MLQIGQARSLANHSALPLLNTDHQHLSLIITLIKSGKCSIPASPLVCLLGDLDGVTTEDNTIHMAFTALCIAKKTVLMNWKNKNNLNINQYRDYLWDYISLETASADTLDQSLWAPLISSIT